MPEAALAGSVALVTGGSRGIGRACALALGAMGADVAVVYGSNAEAAEAVSAELRALGVRGIALEAELRSPEVAAALVGRCVGELGRIDIVVNNAGITRDGLALRMSDEDWNEVIAVDLTAAFLVCRAALRPMIRQRSGRIINMSSFAGVRANAGQANYSAAKAGLIGLTRSLAKEVGSRGITVNAVAPGFIDTDMTAQLAGAHVDQVIAAIPAGRSGTADEVAAAVAFLASPAAAYVNGHVLCVDGGLAA